jgi:hypothetical protein
VIHALRLTDPRHRALLRHPDRLADRPLVSTSLVDERSESFGSAGFILSVPPANIVATASRDAGTDNYTRDVEGHAANLNARFGITTPRKLLTQGESLRQLGLYNEVVAAGRTARGGPIGVQGVFVLIDADTGRPRASAADRRALGRTARTLGVPVVELHPPPAMDDLQPSSRGGLAWRRSTLHRTSSNGTPLRVSFATSQEDGAEDFAAATRASWRDRGRTIELSLAPGDGGAGGRTGRRDAARIAREVRAAFGPAHALTKRVVRALEAP